MPDSAAAQHAVLIVEDEAALRIAAVETLMKEGFNVLEAVDGIDALDTLRAHPEVRLLISDVRMPRLGGYELAEAAFDVRPKLKVVLMTGYDLNPPSTITNRGIPVLQKPFQLDRLCKVARDLMPQD